MTLEFSALDYHLGNNHYDYPVQTYNILSWDKIKNIKSTPVNLLKFPKSEYNKIGEKFLLTCLKKNAVGLAAPQVGLFKRTFMVEQFDTNVVPECPTPFFTLFLNPSWTPKTSEQSTEIEYCLSVLNKGYPIKRYKTIKITYDVFSAEGFGLIRKSKTLTGQEARIFQHEHSHLNGISIPQLWEMQNKRKKNENDKL